MKTGRAGRAGRAGSGLAWLGWVLRQAGQAGALLGLGWVLGLVLVRGNGKNSHKQFRLALAWLVLPIVCWVGRASFGWAGQVW
ncbi:hypothetical protein BY996DRAFT_6463990 [Phakopsora pachyrhizi]|nr:hypothetical protein BY996DRAFT_6463990 [Phakopsora pachyrhizi]